MTVTLRKAVYDDAEAVVAVGHATWPVTYGPIAGDDYVRMGLERWWTVDGSLPGILAGRCTVAEVDGRIVAVGLVGPMDGDLVLFRLYVMPDHQGQGLGATLLEQILEDARQSGHQTIRLSYLEGNDGARRFYERHGFVEDHREPTGAGVPDSVWMIRDLWQGSRG